MPETYAVVWAEADQPITLGRMELLADGFRLLGDGEGGVERVVRTGDIADVRLGSGPADRLRDMKTVVVSRNGAPAIRIAAVNGLGAVFEIAEVLGHLHHGPGRFQSVLVRVPIRRERLEAVRELIRQGPPFDPDEIPGLRRHEVFISEHEVSFLFQGRDVRAAVDQLARNPAVWKAALQWRSCVAARPSIVESAFQWSLDQEPARS